MKEKEKTRFAELYKLGLLNTPSDEELDEITRLASLVCDTPISLISLFHHGYQWFKSGVGFNVTCTPIEKSFCRKAIDSNKELYIVNDPENNEDFNEKDLVSVGPENRFYAGVPLKTKKGKTLGVLCVIDAKKRTLSQKQEEILKILGKQAARIIEYRRLIDLQQQFFKENHEELINLTDNFPGMIIQMEMSSDGKLRLPFISKGISVIHPNLEASKLKDDASKGFEVLHHDDVEKFKEGLMESRETLCMLNVEYRIAESQFKDRTTWHWIYAKPKKLADGTVLWYGCVQDISEKKAYVETLEKIIFDISHLLRRPVANLLGLTDLLQKEAIQYESVMKICKHIDDSAKEIDHFVHILNDSYSEKRQKYTSLNLDRDN